MASTPFYIFENTKAPSSENSFSLARACHEILATNASEIPKCFQEIQKLSQQGYFLAGCISYEAGLNFLDIKSARTSTFPLLQFHAFKEKSALASLNENPERLRLTDFKRDITYDQYLAIYHKVQHHLLRGDTYQVNLSLRESFNGPLNSLSLYNALKESQKVSYSAYISLENYDILSFSPELFLKKEGTSLYSLPMKGTSEVSSSCSQIDLENDPKSISENTMIVDLIRNDLSLIAKRGSVKADKLCIVEEFETLNQMISEVRCEVDEDISLHQIFRAMFPCGSITGAPKKSTMEIIDNVEKSERGIYTGAIGYIEPTGNFQFSVGIRTLLGDKNGCYTYGLGSGVLADSDPKKEHDEIWLKSKFIKKLNSHFYLFETMHLQAGRLRNLDQHLRRLENSANYFGFAFNRETICQQLSGLENMPSQQKCKLILRYDGTTEIEITEFKENTSAKIVTVSKKTNDSKDIFFQHKTSNRTFYEEEYKIASSKGYYDIVFFNEMGHLTEASRHNIFLSINNAWYTPKIDSGILPGVQRSLSISKLKAIETILNEEDLHRADQILLTNSLKEEVLVSLN